MFACCQAVQPCATVVELCKSRTAVMWSGDDQDITVQSSSHSTPNSHMSVQNQTLQKSAEEGHSTVNFDSEGRERHVEEGRTSHKASPAGACTTSAPSSSQGGRRPWWWPASASPSNMLQLSGGSGGFAGAMSRSIQLGGQSALLLRVLMSNLAGLAAGTMSYRDIILVQIDPPCE
jgi:hypothetical protein